jgi:hypothetical protein
MYSYLSLNYIHLWFRLLEKYLFISVNADASRDPAAMGIPYNSSDNLKKAVRKSAENVQNRRFLAQKGSFLARKGPKIDRF